MASTSTSARTLLSRSFAAARHAMSSRPPLPTPAVRVTAPRTVVRSAPRSSLVATSTRWFSSTAPSSSSSSSSSSPPSSSSPSSPSPSSEAEPTSSHGSPALGAPESEATGAAATGKQPLGKIEPRLSLTFTCQAGPEKDNPVCGHRSSHEFDKKSYEKGVVIIQCPECKARHLIADHLGWFNVSGGDCGGEGG